MCKSEAFSPEPAPDCRASKCQAPSSRSKGPSSNCIRISRGASWWLRVEIRILLSKAIQACRKQGKYVGICGQGPSDHPDLALWLVREGIQSISLNPDTVIDTWHFLAGHESHESLPD
ncbi:MAG: hypothetical protein EBX64_02480 [Betaproteobacteria bacterium]|nr:hypothetical protein [Betaproteobacteria bacterium]